LSYTLESIQDEPNNDNQKLLSEMLELYKSTSGELNNLSFTQLFKGENDDADAYIDIQSGSGGTEAQDWVAMIMRMYLKWIEKHSFKSEITEAFKSEENPFYNDIYQRATKLAIKKWQEENIIKAE